MENGIDKSSAEELIESAKNIFIKMKKHLKEAEENRQKLLRELEKENPQAAKRLEDEYLNNIYNLDF